MNQRMLVLVWVCACMLPLASAELKMFTNGMEGFAMTDFVDYNDNGACTMTSDAFTLPSNPSTPDSTDPSGPRTCSVWFPREPPSTNLTTLPVTVLQTGFEVKFAFQFGPTYGTSQQDLIGRGLLFALSQSGSTVVSPASGEGFNLGLLDTPNSFGIGVMFDGTSSANNPALVVALGTGNYTPIASAPYTFGRTNTNIHTVVIQYNTVITPYTINVYVDNVLQLAAPANISQYIRGNTPIYFGFTGSSGTFARQTQTVLKYGVENSPWCMQLIYAAQNAKMYYAGAGLAGFWSQGANVFNFLPQPSLYIPAFRTGAIGLSRDYRPGDVVCFIANRTAGDLPGAYLELRANNRAINLEGQMRCTNVEPSSSWTSSASTEWLSFPPGVEYGDNSVQNITDPYRYVYSISPIVKRVWTANLNDLRIWCRVVVPRFCNTTSSSNCINNETCDTQKELCVCNFPYTGVNCSIPVTPVIQSVQPVSGSVLGNGNITVTARLMYIPSNTARVLCDFSGTRVAASFVRHVDSTYSVVTCKIPAYTAAGGVVNVGILNNLPSANVSNTVQFTYYATPSIIGFTPSNSTIAGNKQITVSGSFPALPSGLQYYCMFDTTFVPATASGTDLVCTTPVHAPGLVVVGISVNQIEVHTSNAGFIFYDPAVSEYCRQFKQENPSSEFPFVGENVLGGGITFPMNVAARQTVVAASGVTLYDASQVVDNDYCCQIGVNSSVDGSSCGLFYPVSLFNGNDLTLNITLRNSARVNELTTTWYDPCLNMPAQYQLCFKNGNNVWECIAPRRTIGNTSCDEYPGDNGNVAFCVDYFTAPNATTLIEAREFMLKIKGDLPIGSPGASLYEVALHGVYLDYPYFIKPTGTAWTNSSSVRIKAARRVSVTSPAVAGTFNLQLLTIKNSTTLAVNDVPLTVYLIDKTTNQDVSGQFFSDSVVRTQYYRTDVTNNNGLFSDLELVDISVGQYQLIFSSFSLQNLTLEISVTPGDVDHVAVLDETRSREITEMPDERAEGTLNIGPVHFCLFDTVDNFVANVNNPQLNANVTQVGGANTLVFGGDVGISFDIDGCAVMDELLLINPAKGNYTLEFSVTVSGTKFSSLMVVYIKAGYVAKLVYSGPAFINNVDKMTSPRLMLTDGAGNEVWSSMDDSEKQRFENATVTITRFVPDDVLVSGDQTVAPLVEGIAIFSALDFKGIHGETYNVTFALTPLMVTVADTIVTIGVLPCDQVITNSLPNSLGYSCDCAAGFERANNSARPECLACPVDYYKPLSGSDIGCQRCTPGLKDTFGKEGAIECVCDVNHYLAPGTTNDDECSDCPDGGQCGNNTILGNQEGFWSSGTPNFYPCYRGSAPSKNDEAAAKEACPASLSLMTSDSTACGEGYEGIRCLTCDDGYGSSGPYCRKCPDDGLNIFVVVLCALVILAILVFLVYQGRTPKNKESVSTKILLNHIQMLALLASLGAVWSQPFFEVLLVGGVATFVDIRVISVDCAIRVSFYETFGFYMLIPVFTVVICGLICLGVYLFKAWILPYIHRSETQVVHRGQIRRALVSQFILAVTVISFIVYPAICVKVMEMFDCSVEVDGKSYLNAAPNEECGTSTHTSFMIWAIIMLIVFCVGAPLTALVMLYKYRRTDNESIQMIVRFFYDGFKSHRYYWEIFIITRKLLIVVFIIIFRNNVLHQIYGMMFVVQAATISHILLRPYTSGRQFRLELWSLVAILITLFVSLYIVQRTNKGIVAVALSTCVLLLHIFVVLAFMFFIGRGLMRRFLTTTWALIVQRWRRIAPKKIKKNAPKFHKVMNFFELFAQSEQYDRDILFANLERWWRHSPNYKRRRLINVVTVISQNTPYERITAKPHTNHKEESTNTIELHELEH